MGIWLRGPPSPTEPLLHSFILVASGNLVKYRMPSRSPESSMGMRCMGLSINLRRCKCSVISRLLRPETWDVRSQTAVPSVDDARARDG